MKCCEYNASSGFELAPFSDHPIDPPKADNDPWDCEFPEDCGFELKPIHGVYNVFRSKDDVISGQPIQVLML
jgi:hypothetical protein